MNRVGDMGLSIGFFAIFALFGSIDFATVFSLSSYMNETAITIIGLLLLTGAMAKSAQIPLHSWLPGSMEGSRYFYLILIFLLFYSLLYLNLISWSAADHYYCGAGTKAETIIDFTFCSILPLTHKILNPIVGDLLGDGHLRFTHKDNKGQVRGNAHYAMTLKHYDYAFYLWKYIYSSICTTTPLRPWPNPIVTGKTPTQYAFSSKSLPALTELHSQWYKLDKEKNKFIKIVPLNIGDLLTPIGLAHWLMGDGYWDKTNKTIVICTDNFTFSEVELLIAVLKSNFNITTTIQHRIKANKERCWRIRFSGKTENISKVIKLVRPHFIPLMLYKLNISTD